MKWPESRSADAATQQLTHLHCIRIHASIHPGAPPNGMARCCDRFRRCRDYSVNTHTPAPSLRAAILLCVALLAGCATPKTDPASTSKENTSNGAAPPTSDYRAIKLDTGTLRWWHNATVYEIWPRSFKDSDGDGHGDFRGMIEKLDYLKGLGVDAIWLTPVFEAPSYHGYDFQDFYAIEKDYGTMADFEAFVAESHKRGIKVILDLVINHISDQHEWFLKSARKEPGYEDYFIWRETRPEGWGQAWSDKPNPEAVWYWNETRKAYYYAAFGGSQPDVNLRNPKVVEEMNKLADFWLKKGADGFRLDAVRYAIEDGPIPGQADTKATIDYWTQFTQHVKAINPDAVLVAEAWAPLQTVGRYRDSGKGLDAAFDFDFGEMVIGILNPQSARTADFGTVSDSANHQNRENLWNNLQNRANAAPMNYFSPFLTNHDRERVMYFLDGDVSKAKIAASALLTSPGAAYLYYGEELGMSQAGAGDDHRYRRAIMPWSDDEHAGFNGTGRNWIDAPNQPKSFSYIQTAWWAGYWKTLRGKGHSVAAQQADPNSVLHHYKRLLSVRNANPNLKNPQEIRYYPVNNDKVWMMRALGQGQNGQKHDTWVLINLDPAKASTFTVPGELRGERKDQLSGQAKAIGETLMLNAGETLVF
jgi:alpha-amylase